VQENTPESYGGEVRMGEKGAGGFEKDWLESGADIYQGGWNGY
jgi:hypothetical protein